MQTFSPDENPLASGAPHAWDRLIEAVGPAALLVVIESRMSTALRQHLTPEDIWQETLLHAWRDRAQFEWRGLRSFRNWLLTLIDHRISHSAAAAGTQKRGGARAAQPFSALPDSNGDITGLAAAFPAGSTTPSRLAIHREQAAAMHAALDTLSPEQRDVIRLRVFEQLTLEEIAERTGLHVSAVRRRFGQGLQAYETALRSTIGTRPVLNSATPDA